MLRLKTLVATIAATALLPLAAEAQIKDRQLKMAIQNVADTPQGRGIAKFAEIVKAKSGGKIDVRLFPGGQLGGDLQTVSALQGGTVDLTVLNAGLLVGLNKEFALLDVPFLFNTPEEADKIVDGPLGQRLHKSVEEKGLIGLGYWELGFRNVTNSKRPINNMDDFKGIKLRVLQSPLFISVFNGLGANAVPMAWPEVYGALEQRVVDGQENPYSVILGAKLYEVQKYLTNTRHIYNAQSVLISRKTWADMSAEEKKIIQDAADEARAFQRKDSRDTAAQGAQELKAKGMQVNDVAPEAMTRIRDAVKPIIDKFAADTGGTLFAEINAELAKSRK